MDSLLLILDLDETLIHATMRPLDRAPNFKVWGYHVYKRPHVDEFVRHCLQHFRVAVWTTASNDYAAYIVGRIFSDPSRLEFLWSRDRCTVRRSLETGEYYWIKNLHKVERIDYALERVLVVDDSADKHVLNYGNLIQVAPFVGDPNDNELKLLWPYLETFKHIENVRTVEKRGWKISV